MLRIVDTVLALITEVAPLADDIGRRDPALAKQLRDALNSVALNLGEGSGQRGARQTSHYAIALGSARESLVALRAAGAWRYIGPLPEHIADDFVIARHVQLASRQGDKATALDEFRNLCESPIEASWPISSARAALRHAGWVEDADNILKENIIWISTAL